MSRRHCKRQWGAGKKLHHFVNLPYILTHLSIYFRAQLLLYLSRFIFISVVYKTLPEPSWFPNTTGIGLAAVKMYLYWTMGAYFLSGFSLVAFSMFYIVALYRIHTNAKISLPVCWVQLSGPAVVLYGFTIFSQPGSFGDNSALLIPENKAHFTRIHQQYYMPVLHVLFAFCMISMVSSLYLLRARWKTFRDKQFSPAHVSFCAPLFSHANAMQAYMSSLNLFSPLPPESMFKVSWSTPNNFLDTLRSFAPSYLTSGSFPLLARYYYTIIGHFV